jgi:hypothetical protein
VFDDFELPDFDLLFEEEDDDEDELFDEELLDDELSFTSLPSALRLITRDEGAQPRPTTSTNRVRSDRFMAVSLEHP